MKKTCRFIGVVLVVLMMNFVMSAYADAAVLPEDFESGWNGWYADNGVWEVGTPTVGPPNCHSGSQCAGTILGGNYPTDTDSRLISPSFRLPAVSGDTELHLRFWN